MTIKKRLALSNILMIVIPVLISLAIALLSMFITWLWVVQSQGNKQDQYISYDKIIDQTAKVLDGKKSSESLETILNNSEMNVVAIDSSGNRHDFGKEELIYEEKLLDLILSVEDLEFADINTEGVYAQHIKSQLKDISYKICILYSFNYNESDNAYYKALNTRMIIVVAVTVISIILSIILTNWFLTRFVFTKIKQSIIILADGVHHIRDGNLDYRINYDATDEFTAICEDFNEMALRLAQSIELTKKQEANRKELLAYISHDIRSPLTSIKAYVEGLIDGVAKTHEAQVTYMRMIKTKAEDIDNLVSKIFLFSKMDLGEYPYTPEELLLNQEISSYLKATGKDYESKGLTISLQQPKEDIYIYVDPLQLRSVFSNILENNLKYKDKLDSQSEIIIIKMENKVRITFEDDGPGVPEPALDKLFDIFYRSDPSRNNPNKGSGLGLAITAKAVNRMGGIIYAQNRMPRGLRIVIEIPLQQSKEKLYEKNTNH